MITLLSGENSYSISHALGQVVADFDGEAEKFDGAALELRQLPDLLMGAGLFADRRLVIIRDLAANKALWDALPSFLGRISEDIHLVLVEPSPDKRTKTYKALQKVADVQDFPLLTERDSAQAERWLTAEAERRGVQVDRRAARALLQRSLVPTERGQPVIDQWQVIHSLDKLSVFNEVTIEVVEKYIDAQPIESVFSVLETALRGDTGALHQLLADLEPREDPFKVLGLLSSQLFQLAVIVAGEVPAGEAAKAVGAHPFALNKLVPYARKIDRQTMGQIVGALVEADEAVKLSKAAPWTLIEQALMKIAGAAKRI